MPPNDGLTSGDGSFLSDTEVTVTATANVGSHFVNWTYVNGLAASTDAIYTFTITTNTTLIGNFAAGEADAVPLEIAQIAVSSSNNAPDVLYALGVDGTLWKLAVTHVPDNWRWTLIPGPLKPAGQI